MRFFIISALAVVSAGAAVAQESALEKLQACAAVAGATQRLDCYDAAAASFKQAQAAGDIQVVTREQATEGAKQAFGLRAPESADAARVAAGAAPVQAAAPSNVMLKLTAIEKRADGKSRFVMDNGQVWEQVDSDRIGRVKTFPVSAEIKTAALGSFMMKIDGGTAIRVRRVK